MKNVKTLSETVNMIETLTPFAFGSRRGFDPTFSGGWETVRGILDHEKGTYFSRSSFGWLSPRDTANFRAFLDAVHPSDDFYIVRSYATPQAAIGFTEDGNMIVWAGRSFYSQTTNRHQAKAAEALNNLNRSGVDFVQLVDGPYALSGLTSGLSGTRITSIWDMRIGGLAARYTESLAAAALSDRSARVRELALEALENVDADALPVEVASALVVRAALS